MPTNSAEYQREYRARKRAEKNLPPQKPDLAAPEGRPALEHRTRRQQAARKIQNPYQDGYDDWPQIIQRMRQHQRDRLLERINTSGSKNR